MATWEIDEAAIEAIVAAYWHKYYAADCCTLCGNYGVIDTTGTLTPAGAAIGRKHYCICPAGQALRQVAWAL
jgi:hypothetical protein